MRKHLAGGVVRDVVCRCRTYGDIPDDKVEAGITVAIALQLRREFDRPQVRREKIKYQLTATSAAQASRTRIDPGRRGKALLWECMRGAYAAYVSTLSRDWYALCAMGAGGGGLRLRHTATTLLCHHLAPSSVGSSSGLADIGQEREPSPLANC